MNRYLFTVSGQMEVNAETEEQALAMIKDKCITHFDEAKQIFVLVVPASNTPFHSEAL